MDYRTETDSMGKMNVPVEKYWGAQTQRSLKNFDIGAETFPLSFIQALAIVKKACALTNAELGVLAREKAEAIAGVCDEIMTGRMDEEFPLSVWQTGSGTQTNMNINEVIANRAIELSGGEKGSKSPIHPNDDVNKSQSSNDVFPAAMHVTAANAVNNDLLPALEDFLSTLNLKQKEFKDIVKIGRTHFMDATPVTLGQEISGYAALIEKGKKRVEQALEEIYELTLGGTAVGTGLNAPEGFAEKSAEKIAELTGLAFKTSDNKFASQGCHDALAALSAALKVLAVSLNKIANDVRFMASGPRCGIGEVILPANEPGSSIMPGKINPTQCEALIMVCMQVMGNDTTIALACASGNLELNVAKPVIIYNLLQSIDLLADSVKSFNDKCFSGIQPNTDRIRENLEKSLMLVTALTPKIGYDKASEIAKKAYQENISLKSACLALGYLSETEFDSLINPSQMT